MSLNFGVRFRLLACIVPQERTSKTRIVCALQNLMVSCFVASLWVQKRVSQRANLCSLRGPGRKREREREKKKKQRRRKERKRKRLEHKCFVGIGPCRCCCCCPPSHRVSFASSFERGALPVAARGEREHHDGLLRIAADAAVAPPGTAGHRRRERQTGEENRRGRNECRHGMS